MNKDLLGMPAGTGQAMRHSNLYLLLFRPFSGTHGHTHTQSLPDSYRARSQVGVGKTDPLPGATIISFFLERIRRKVRSFWGSISRTVLRAFKMKLCMRLAYCVVVGLSMVLLMGMPEGRAETEQNPGSAFLSCSQPHTQNSRAQTGS